MKLSVTELRWARDILDAMFPGGVDPRLPHGAGDMDIEAYFDDLSRVWPTLPFLVFRVAIVVIALAPVIVLRRFRTFHSITREQRVHVLDVMYGSRFYVCRQMVIALKASGGIFFGSHPSVRSALAPGLPVPLVQLQRKGA